MLVAEVDANLRRVAVVDASLVVADSGRGAPIVLLHGLSLDHTIWDAQAVALESAARVIRPDLRGHGASSVTAGPYSIELFTDDLTRVLDDCNVERATIAGHSLGGFVALSFFRSFPERVSGLMLIGSKAGTDSPQMVAMRLQLADSAEKAPRSTIADADLQALFSRRTQAEHGEILERVRKLIERSDPRAGAASLRAIANRRDSRDLLEKVEVPFAILLGDEDCFITVEESEESVGRVRMSTLDVIEQCGHHPMLEAPDRATAALARLVGRETHA